MENGKRIQITLAQNVVDKLEAYCLEKGMKRSAVITLALNNLWKEEGSAG